METCILQSGRWYAPLHGRGVLGMEFTDRSDIPRPSALRRPVRLGPPHHREADLAGEQLRGLGVHRVYREHHEVRVHPRLESSAPVLGERGVGVAYREAL